MSSISSTEYNEYSLDAAVELELSVVGLGSGRCSSSCRASKRPVRLENGSSSMSEHESALAVIELIRASTSSREQANAVMRLANIKYSAKKINVKQLDTIVDIFHNILGAKDFPPFH